MKAIGLIGLLLTLLIIALLMVKQMKTPSVALAPLGKDVTLQEAPKAVQENVDNLMKQEAKHLQAVDKESNNDGQ